MSATPLNVFITGANTGIGFETVKALIASPQPFKIFLGSRDIAKGNAAASLLQGEVQTSSTITPVQIDITDDNSIEEALKTISQSTDHLDVLINNAGATFDPDYNRGSKTMRAAWDETYDLNVSGSQVVTYTFTPLLLRSSDARLLFVTSGHSSLEFASSRTGIFAPPPAGWPKVQPFRAAAYAASKSAMNRLMLEWARVLAADGVRCWCISPGRLATGLGGDPELLKRSGSAHPSLGGEFIRDVVEGKRDADAGKVVDREGVQPW